MSDTTFVANQTVIEASWLNEINDHVHSDTLASPRTSIHNANTIGYTPTGTVSATNVQAAIDEVVADLASTDSGKGAELVGRGAPVVSSITALRALVKTAASKHAFVTGYYAQGDGGGGMYWYDGSDTTSADNGGTVIVAADGGRWKLANTTVSIRNFGARADWNGSSGTDNSSAIENAIVWSAQSGNAVLVDDGLYYTTKPLRFNSIAGDTRHMARLVGRGKAEIYSGKGAIFYVDAGAGKACAEIIDSYHCNLIGVGLCAIRDTSLGVVFARGTFNAGPGHHLMRDCMIYVKSAAGTNSGVGSIGVLNIACEETILDNCDVWAALPYAGVATNTVTRENVNGAGLPNGTQSSFSYASYYGTTIVSTVSSNTVFKLTGQGRLIALNSQSPNVLLETTSDIDLGHTFMQRVLDAADPGAVVGQFHYALHLTSVFGITWRGTVEHCESLALVRGEVDELDITCTLGSEAATLAEVMFYEPAATDRPLRNWNMRIRGITAKPIAKCIRATPTSVDVLFKMKNVVIESTSPMSLANADTGFWSMLNIADESEIVFGNSEQSIRFSKGTYQFEKEVDHSSTNILVSIYMPDTGATGAFRVGVTADCVTTNLNFNNGAVSIHTSQANWAVANGTGGFGPNYSAASTAKQTINLVPATSNLTALVPSGVTTAGLGQMDFVITPTIGGAAPTALKTKASCIVSMPKRDGHAILIV